ncbi:hypothetical protein MHU86_663 [Fragilaria crotonensis]|nr:hypothetical protein MHU86_663 [Fragilaria crotonensis]
MTTRTSVHSLLVHLLLFSLSPICSTGAKIEATGECLPINGENNAFHCVASTDIILCRDNHESCAKWAQRGECKKNAAYMLFNCRKSCETCVSLHHGVTQLCPSPEKLQDTVNLLIKTQQYIYDRSSVKAGMFLSCVSHDPNCATLALDGECRNNPAWMAANCPAVCQLCK